MKFFVISVAVSLVAGQQFQQNLDLNPAVRLAGSGFFSSGSALLGNNRNNQFQSRGSNIQLDSLSNNRNSESLTRFQNDNQFQFGRTSFQQNQKNALNSFGTESQNGFQPNRQNRFSSVAFQQGSGNQFQTVNRLSSSQFNDGSRFDSNQGISRIQSQTFAVNQQGVRRNPLTAINIQLTPSIQFQDPQRTGSSFQPNNNQQTTDNRFQQTDFSGIRINNNNNNNNNIQFNANRQLPSESNNRVQLNSASSLNQFTDEADGVFEPLNLPSGATRLLGRISSSFSCANRPYGYYADQDNSCRVFHVCNPALFSDGKIETYQYSFMCGEGTLFDQDEMTCKAEYDATPCQEAANFYFRNEQFGRL